MITLFIYDISEDKIRNKVAQLCQDYGLKRIQYSAFLGRIPDGLEDEFWAKCRRHLGEQEGNLQMFYLTMQTLERSRKYLGRPTDQTQQPPEKVRAKAVRAKPKAS